MGLVDYTMTHFAFEEDLMKRSGYPLSEAHKSVHNAFTANIGELVEQHESGEDITRKLLSTLQIWLMNHIKNDDKDYSADVKKMLNTNKGWIRRTVGRLFK